MKQIEFNKGDRVVTIKDGELRKGIIKNFYPVNPPIFAIEFEDGTVEKIPFDNVAPEPKAEITVEENEPREKSEITITPDKFQEIAVRVIAENTKGRKAVGLAFVRLMVKIHMALFVEPWEND